MVLSTIIGAHFSSFPYISPVMPGKETNQINIDIINEGGEAVRGSKYPPEVVNEIMGIWIATHNAEEVARQTKLPVGSIKSIVKRHMFDEQFAEAQQKTLKKYGQKIEKIISMSLDRMIGVLDNKEEKIPLNHLSTEVGTMIDKFLLLESIKSEENEEESGCITISAVTPLEGDDNE